VKGVQRGRAIGIPTINIDPTAAKDLMHGVYACRVELQGKTARGVMHFGPRPVFKDSLSCEIHLLERETERVPRTINLTVVAWIRPVMNLPSPEALVERIREDIRSARAILET
jgi:riboflavin kinase/FMN adenylyltransferase